MANWTKRSPTGTTTRRKWNLEDRTSLNNLKYHIAAEGCSEVQYDLARQLLEKSIEQNEETSSEQAVQWLLNAAVQGHEDSAKLLQECYDLRRGITAENEAEVRCCLSLTPGERAARKAARELFACLSNGGEHVTPKQLERKMREIYKLQKKRRRRNNSTSEEDTEEESAEPLENANSVKNGHLRMENGQNSHTPRAELNVNNRNDGDQRMITEENLVSAAVNYAAGRMPAVNDALTLSVPHPATLDHVPCFHRLLFHPVIFCTLLYHRFINFVSSFPNTVPSSIRLTLLVVVYWLVSNENLTIFLPTCFYYLCLMVMIWSTCKMLKTKHEFIDFRIWSGLFLSYGDNNIEANLSENRFLKNNMKPYLYFFCAFVCNLVVYPLIASEWLPHSEITILSCVFVFITLLTFMYTSAAGGSLDWIVLISFGVNVLAKYPYEMDEVVTTGWRFLDLKVPTFCSFVIGNGIEFCLNCRTALYLLIPGFLIHLAKRSRWHGTYTHLIPHCVTLSWLQLGITTSRSATMFGVLRATLGLAGMLLFLPLFGIISLMVPVFVAIEWLGLTDPRIRLGSTIAAAGVALLGSCFLALNRWTQKYITTLQVIICIISASILTLPYMTSNFKDTSRFGNIISNEKRDSVISAPDDHQPLHSDLLTWQKFYSFCGQPAWEHHNKIKAQLRCSHLNGLPVLWEGSVTNVQISRVSNFRAHYLDKYFPRWLANVVKCIWGENNSGLNNCDTNEDPLCAELYRILKDNGMENKCSLHKWNTYEYEVTVKMSSGLLSKSSDVVLHGTHKFGNFTSRIFSGDRIEFYGTLLNSHLLTNGLREDFILGTANTQVELLAIKCVLCQDKDIMPVALDRPAKSPVDARLRDLTRGIKYLLNVLFNPLITFK